MPSKKIFLSYRRALSSYMARAIYQHLKSEGYDVFMDVESIDSGEFRSVILNQIEARPHFLLILSPESLDRTINEDDWLRCEIEHAMKAERNVVPVMDEHFNFDEEKARLPKKELPGELSRLSGYSGLTVPAEFFDSAMEKLTDRFLNRDIEAPIAQVPERDRAIVRKMIKAADRETELNQEKPWFEKHKAAIGGGVAVLLALAILFIAFPGRSSNSRYQRGPDDNSNGTLHAAVLVEFERCRSNSGTGTGSSRAHRFEGGFSGNGRYLPDRCSQRKR